MDDTQLLNVLAKGNTFQEIYDNAVTMARNVAMLKDRELGNEASRGFDCGFAWVHMKGNIPFARWLKKRAHSRGSITAY
jgi:hypothetical protein